MKHSYAIKGINPSNGLVRRFRPVFKNLQSAKKMRLFLNNSFPGFIYVIVPLDLF